MKYVPGPQFGQFSGSQGNTTASHNRFGSYIRNRVIPVNPNTPAQSVQRNNVQEIAALWRTLTAAQRLDWSNLGAQIERLNTQGQPYTLTGSQAHMMINRNRRLAGVADVADAPPLENPTLLTTAVLTATVSPDALSVAFTPTPLAAGERIIIEMSRPVSAGRSFMPRSELKLITVSGLAPTSPQNVLAAWQAIYADFDLGQRIFGRARVLTANYFSGAPINFNTVVVSGV